MVNQQDYSLTALNQRIREARLYRGHKTQGIVCDSLGISRQLWSMIELGKRVPRIMYVVAFANLLKIEMNFFFTPGALIEDYDRLKEK